MDCLIVLSLTQNVDQGQVAPSSLQVDFSSIDIPMSHSNVSCQLSEVVFVSEELSATLNVTNCSGSGLDLMRLYSTVLYIPTKSCQNYNFSDVFPLSESSCWYNIITNNYEMTQTFIPTCRHSFHSKCVSVSLQTTQFTE